MPAAGRTEIGFGIGRTLALFVVVRSRGSIDPEQRAALCEIFATTAVGEKAVMTDAMEPVWQCV